MPNMNMKFRENSHVVFFFFLRKGVYNDNFRQIQVSKFFNLSLL